MSTPPMCSHGYCPSDGPTWTVHTGGGDGKAIKRHKKSCTNPRVFWHPGWLFRVICCAGCGTKLR